ncbi:MAG: uracil-DNA glycosylase [Pseudomonadota bacterium]|nr:uracil-DNA glycosylase [Pseudomonadota bacterium]
MKVTFNPSCTRCPRLADYLKEQRSRYTEYFNAPVPAFGDPKPNLLIVGLAPGRHGANASGRPFTGDFAGKLLYRTLFELDLCTKPESVSVNDGLELVGCRITNAVKCLPPENKPTTLEVRTCNDYLRGEIDELPNGAVIFALGGIAHQAILRAFTLKLSGYSFGHGVVHRLPGQRTMVDSYHCSRYNTQTGRLTADMFREALALAKELATVSA